MAWNTRQIPKPVVSSNSGRGLRPSPPATPSNFTLNGSRLNVDALHVERVKRPQRDRRKEPVVAEVAINPSFIEGLVESAFMRQVAPLLVNSRSGDLPPSSVR